MTSLASSGVRRACSPPLLASSCGRNAAESHRSFLSSHVRVVDTCATRGGGHGGPGACLARVGRVFGASEAKQFSFNVQGCAWGSRGLCLAAPHALHLSPEHAAGHQLTSVHSLCHMLPLRAASKAPTGATTCKVQNRQIRAALSGDVTAALSEVGAFLTAQPPSWAATLAVNGAIFSLGYPVLRSGLTSAGIASAFLLGVAAWKGFGPEGYAIVCLYFVLGTAVTKLRLKQKEAEGIAEQRQGRRGPASVIGSAASAVACAAGAGLGLGGAAAMLLWQLGYVACFCTKLSDTTASEVGKAYGKTTYLITNLSLVPRGTEGAVSLEGTLAGLLAAVVLAGVALAAGLVDVSGAGLAVGASQFANVFESWLGATSQGKKGLEWLSNDLVNVFNISLGSTLAIVLRVLLSNL